MAENPDPIKGLFIMINQSSSVETSNDTYSWLYQVCTEFGWHQTFRESNNNFIGMNITTQYYDDLCRDIFGSK